MSEIAAMGAVHEALEPLDEDERKRVLRWAVDKYGGGDVRVNASSGGAGSSDRRSQRGGGAKDLAAGEFERIADLVDAAGPDTIADHVLVGTYWFQVVKGNEDVTGMQVNNELKNLGRPASNITDSYSTLIERKPALARQVRKSGTTRQARKKYRLTHEGIRRVEQMIAGSPGDE
jgi:hypothetical protein